MAEQKDALRSSALGLSNPETKLDIGSGRDTEFRTFCLVCLGAGVLLRLRFMKCGFLGVPFKIYSIDVVDSTHYSVVIAVSCG